MNPSHLKMLADEYKPYFYDHKIKAWDNVLFESLQPFIKEHYWCCKESINIFRVVGTSHPDYAGLTWREFLDKGKRMPLNLQLFDSNPGYYTSPDIKKPEMYYMSIDGGDIYIGEDGNHRTGIAKFEFFMKKCVTFHGVQLQDHKVNWSIKKLHDELVSIIDAKELPYRVKAIKTPVSREDSSGWMRQIFHTSFSVTELRSNNSPFILEDMTQIEAFLDKISSNSSRSIFASLFGKR